MRTLQISEYLWETFQYKKLNLINVCNNLQHCIIQCKIQVICLINSLKHITVYPISKLYDVIFSELVKLDKP